MVENMRVNLRMVNLMEKENDYTQNVAPLKESIKIIKPMDKGHTLIYMAKSMLENSGSAKRMVRELCI
jgi:hypothetical protein